MATKRRKGDASEEDQRGRVMEGSERNAAATTSCYLTMYCVLYKM